MEISDALSISKELKAANVSNTVGVSLQVKASDQLEAVIGTIIEGISEVTPDGRRNLAVA